MNGNGNGNENGNDNGNENGNEDQRPSIRLVSRTPRRNSTSQRRTLSHYRVENFANHVTVNNNYIFDANNNSNNRRAPPSPPQLAVPVTVYGPNPSNAFAGNPHTAYLALPPIPYIPPQATHIAIPLSNARIPARIANGTVPPVRLGLPSTSRVVHIPGPQIIGGPAPQSVRFPTTPREPIVTQPQNPVPNAYIVTPDGTYLTIPSSVYTPAPPIVTYVPMPSTSNVGTVTYSYANTGQRVYPPVIPISNIRIFEDVPVPPIETVQITEIESTAGSNEESN